MARVLGRDRHLPARGGQHISYLYRGAKGTGVNRVNCLNRQTTNAGPNGASVEVRREIWAQLIP